MARVASALRAVRLASWRDVQTFGSITGQNLFLFILLIALQPQSAELFAIILALVMIFPLSADPMERVPKDRWQLWPLRARERTAIRVVSLAFSPIVWIAVFLLARGAWRTTGLFLAIVVSVRLAAWVLKSHVHFPRRNLSGWIPKPPGTAGFLMMLQWREMLTTLDPYLAAVLAGVTLAYRAWAKPLEPSALQIMSLITAVAMSTAAQVFFGLDGAGAQRYRLMPIRGWRILLAKDLAYLFLLMLLVAPLDFVSGFFAGLAALTIGHHGSVYRETSQARWRFTSGAILPDGVIQTVVLIGVGVNIRSAGLKLALPCLACWLASIFLYGWVWDRRKVAA